MKIKIIKVATFSFAPAEKIVFFTVGEVCELPEDRAKRLIDHNYAVEYSESEQPEQKMDKIEPENKMFSAKHKAEDKAIDQDSEVKVKHEDSVEKEEDKPKKRGRPKKNK